MIQNSGKEAIIDLLDGRMNVAEAQLANRIGSDIYLDGTGNSARTSPDSVLLCRMLLRLERMAVSTARLSRFGALLLILV
jgi:hypothetical protein